MPHFPRKRSQLRHSKTCKKLKNSLFKRSQHSFLSSSLLQNHFLRRFLWPNFDLNSFERFALLFLKMVSTLPLKTLQKTEKWSFQTLRTFVLELKVTSKPFSKKLPITKYGFKQFWMLCLTLPENGLDFITQKLAKTEKCYFQTLTIFVFHLKVAPKPFPKKVLMTNFWFK